MAIAALAIPEIVHGTLRHVDSKADLVRCACINSTWKAEALKLLWHDAPPIEAMMDLASQNRLYPYLPMIRKHLVVLKDIMLDANAIISAPSISALREFIFAGPLEETSTVRLDMYLPLPLSNEVVIHRCLQPCLRILRLFQGSYGNYLLESIQVHCAKSIRLLHFSQRNKLTLTKRKAPSLRALKLHNRTPELIRDDQLLKFLTKMPDLNCIEGIYFGWDPRPLVSHLAKRQNLTMIRFLGHFPSHTIDDDILSPQGAVFPALRVFEATSIPPEPLQTLLTRLTQLESLEIRGFGGTTADIAKALSKCPQLQELNLGFSGPDPPNPWKDTAMRVTDLAMIGKECPLIRSIDIDVFTTKYESYTVEATDFHTLLETYPNMETAELPFTWCLEAADFQAISKYWPRLHRLTLKQLDLNIEDLQQGMEMLTEHALLHLRQLDMGSTHLFLDSSGAGSVQTDHTVRVMTQLMPALTHITHQRIDDIQGAAFDRFRPVLAQRAILPRPSTVSEIILDEIFEANSRAAARDARQSGHLARWEQDKGVRVGT